MMAFLNQIGWKAAVLNTLISMGMLGLCILCSRRSG